jgi:hypothetical protein
MLPSNNQFLCNLMTVLMSNCPIDNKWWRMHIQLKNISTIFAHVQAYQTLVNAIDDMDVMTII